MMVRSRAPRWWNAEQLCDLFILGLLWKCNFNDVGTITRSASSIFHSLCRANAVNETQRAGLVDDIEVKAFFENYFTELYEGQPTALPALRVVLETSHRYIVTFVPNDEELDRTRYFGIRGYRHGITPLGRSYAQSITAYYGNIVTPESFRAGWQLYTGSHAAGHGED